MFFDFVILQIPYDFYCPTVNPELADRICSSCKLYFASQKAVRDHVKATHKSDVQKTFTKARPTRIVHRQKRKADQEVFCVVRDESNNPSSYGTLEPEKMKSDLSQYTKMALNQLEALPLVRNYAEWITSPWIEANNNLRD